MLNLLVKSEFLSGAFKLYLKVFYHCSHQNSSLMNSDRCLLLSGLNHMPTRVVYEYRKIYSNILIKKSRS